MQAEMDGAWELEEDYTLEIDAYRRGVPYKN